MAKFKLSNNRNVLSDDNYYSHKIPIKLDITMMNSIIGYIFKKSPQITRKTLNNMQRLFEIIDERLYDSNDKLRSRFIFIKRALEARIVRGMENEAIMLNYCSNDNENDLETKNIVENINYYKKLNYEEIRHINNDIKDRLTYSYIAAVRVKMYDILERLEIGDYDSYQDINTELVALCSHIVEKSRQVNVVDQTDTFSLETGTFDEQVRTIVEQLKKPSRLLRTGIQYWNTLLGDGYRSGRVYYYLGLPAGFKSGILLKSAMDIRKYNKNVATKKEGARKTILLVTMENVVEETVERMFNMAITSEDIRKFETEDIIRMMKEEGEFKLVGEDDIDIVIKYYPNRSISTQDLYTIIQDLEDDNREVIALILDYIKRIRPFEYAREEKEELKNITNELKTLAIELDIPVITAHQLNRGAATTVDAALGNSQEDVTRQIGRGNVGSALRISAESVMSYSITPDSIEIAGKIA